MLIDPPFKGFDSSLIGWSIGRHFPPVCWRTRGLLNVEKMYSSYATNDMIQRDDRLKHYEGRSKVKKTLCTSVGAKELPAAIPFLAACWNCCTMSGISWAARARGSEKRAISPSLSLTGKGGWMALPVDDNGFCQLGWWTAKPCMSLSRALVKNLKYCVVNP